MLTLPEEVLLIAYDDDTGRNGAMNLEMGLAGAVLLDLTLRECIDLVDKRVRVLDGRPEPVGDVLLDEVLSELAADKPRRPQSLVSRLAHRMRGRVLDSLVRKRVLYHDQDRVLGLFPWNRYRPVDGVAERQLRSRLEAAVAAGRTDDPRTAALASLLPTLTLEKSALPDRKRSDAKRALKAVGEGAWASDATRKAIEATQAAVMVAVTASITASTASSS